MSMRLALAIVLALAIAFGAYYVYAQPSNTLHVRWLIAHQPTEVFDNARGVFEAELAAKIGRPVRVELIQPQDVGFADEVPAADVVRMLESGDVELATVVVDSLMTEDTDLRVLHLPYLFKDYASANIVLDGEAGDRLLEEVSALTNANALAFTYSGGFRVIASSKKPIREPKDLSGMKISMWGSGLVENGLASLGAIPVRVSVGGGKEELESGKTDAAQFTYTRAPGSVGDGKAVKYVNETNHILFLSTILASNTFVASLTDAERVGLAQAADAAATVERADSIQFAEGVKKQLVDAGAEILPLSASARAAFERWAAAFRAQFDGSESAKDLMRAILSAQNL
jgi:TRAP-type C4-dicarboxylate transport system substrate-binding protein